MEEKKKRKQICFDLDEEIHAIIKSNAALRKITINAWMKSVLWKEIERLKKYE